MRILPALASLLVLLLSQASENRPYCPVGPAEPDTTTKARFADLMAFAREDGLHLQPFALVVQQVGERFLGAPWVEGLLDRSEDEELVVDLTRFDCVLFVEEVLALARRIAVEDYRYVTFEHNLEMPRYRGGQMDGYCSRLHYFSEWIADNEARGLLANRTPEIGGVPLEKRLTPMTEHRSSYPRMAADDSLFRGIRYMERSLGDMELLHILRNRIRDAYAHLRHEDVVATSTHIAGLDVTHRGFVYRHGADEVGFLHASQDGGVKASPDLQRYVRGNRIRIGIVAARPIAT